MVLSTGLFLILLGSHLPMPLCLYLPIVLAAAAVVVLEALLPHRAAWRPGFAEVRDDLTFMVAVQGILPRLLGLAGAWLVIQGPWAAGRPEVDVWPHHWPLPVQVVLMVLAADLLRYWLHRFSHTQPLLWRFHAVHHSPRRLYFLNVGRFHPLEKATQILLDTLPFVLLGVHDDVLGLYLVFYAVNGFFQHCNIDVELGPLNYLISGPQLHRWHHSAGVHEAQHNYGNNTIVWDLAFGTYFLPRDREVGALGLRNTAYPKSFLAQLWTPFFRELDQRPRLVPSLYGSLLKGMLALRFWLLRIGPYRGLRRAARQPAEQQWRVLREILERNQDTGFGRQHGFAAIDSPAAYRARVPVCDYETLRPFIDAAKAGGPSELTREPPVMYNRTSGTTGEPKDIPVLQQTLREMKHSQRIASYLQYRACPEGFSGKLLGLVSPAVDGHLPGGIPYGSASGHLYESMPALLRSRCVVPAAVFGIHDYDLKYYTIALLALAQPDITALGGANPSSFRRLLEVIDEHRDALLADLRRGGSARLQRELPEMAQQLARALRPRPARAAELEPLLLPGRWVEFSTLWPFLRLVVTWTGGSCGQALDRLLPRLPAEITVLELGYLSSELRATITVDARTGGGVPTLQQNFFEFVERDAFEAGEREFVGLESLEQGRRYYVFVTTSAGLYRYAMNDIVQVNGRFRGTPTLRFVQKGLGMTSITGEKVHESQLLDAVQQVFAPRGIHVLFTQALADEEGGQYRVYLEAGDPPSANHAQLEAQLDGALAELNLEYQDKRRSGRLRCLRLRWLRHGTHDQYKRHCLARGQREGQYKCVALRYLREFDFDLESHSLP